MLNVKKVLAHIYFFDDTSVGSPVRVQLLESAVIQLADKSVIFTFYAERTTPVPWTFPVQCRTRGYSFSFGFFTLDEACWPERNKTFSRGWTIVRRIDPMTSYPMTNVLLWQTGLLPVALWRITMWHMDSIPDWGSAVIFSIPLSPCLIGSPPQSQDFAKQLYIKQTNFICNEPLVGAINLQALQYHRWLVCARLV